MPSLRRASILAVVVLALAATGVHADLFDTIRPGDSTSNCTLDFLFEGADGDLYFGIAGHCVANGDRVEVDWHGEIGTVVYDDADQDGGLDIALIDVDDDVESRVAPGLRGHLDVPTGVTDSNQTQVGDRLGGSGHGFGPHVTQTTRQNRTGPLVSDSPTQYCSAYPASFGDSGGPIFHVESGKALGIVSRISPLECSGSLTGPTVQGFLDEVGQNGFDLTLRTV